MIMPFTRCIAEPGMDPRVVVAHRMWHTAINRPMATDANIKTIHEFSIRESIEMVPRYSPAPGKGPLGKS